MATIGNTVLTLSDHAKRIDPDGKTPMIVEMLSQENAALDDMPFMEGNTATGHETTIRTGLPDVFYRKMNMGVPKSKSTTAQVTENAAELVGRSEVDVKVANRMGNTSTFRLSESKAFVMAMGQQQATTLIYGTNANPEEYVGLAARYSDLGAVNAENILSAGGASSDNSSIFLVGWGAETVFGVYPKGSKAGMEHEDLGVIDAFDSNDDRFRAYGDIYTWDNGLVVKDWRYVVRIPNISIADLVAKATTQAEAAATNITKLMSRSIARLPAIRSVTPIFYVNRTVASHLMEMAMDKNSSFVGFKEARNQFGDTIHQLVFMDIPVKIMDVILNTEAVVS
jgi:hypothetical protein